MRQQGEGLGLQVFKSGPLASRVVREEELPVRFKAEPEPGGSSGEALLERWVPELGRGPSAGGFERVRFTDVGGPDLLVRPLLAVAEWNPSLALEHMARRLCFHASDLRLSWECVPLEPPGWQPTPDEEEPEADVFFLQGCTGERAAPQPPRFRRHELRPEQLRSLSWMIDREAQSTTFTTEVQGRIVPGVRWDDQPVNRSLWQYTRERDYWKCFEARCGFAWCYATRLKATFTISGGVLGDSIGSGKTATLIGLLDSQRAEGPSPVPPPEASHLIPNAATLILVPSNLLGQWEGEFNKFLGPDAFKFVIVRTISDLKRLTVQDLLGCEVVLTTYKLFYSTGYVDRLKSLQCTCSNRLHERSFYGMAIEHTLREVEKAEAAVLSQGARQVGWVMRSKTQKELAETTPAAEDRADQLTPQQVRERIQLLGACDRWKDLRCPPLELFFWHRVVFDEFHELEAMDMRRFTLLQNLRCRHRWGLTGTPPRRDKSQVANLAGIMRVHIPEDPVLCQHFLGAFVRQSFSELPEIPVVEHLERVQQTPEERALYLQRAFDGTRCSLLKFCSHHCFEGDAEAGDAAEASGGEEPGGASARGSVDRMGDRKRRERAKQQAAVRAEYQALAALTSGLAGHEDTKAEAEGGARLREAEARARGLGSAELDALMTALPTGGGPGDAAGLARAALQAISPAGSSCSAVLQLLSRGGCRQLAPLRAARAAQLSRCAAALARLVAAERSLRFFQATLLVLSGAEGGAEGRPECSVCLEPLSPSGSAVLPCAHAFHTSCCFALLARQSRSACPTCRAPFVRADVTPVGTAGGPAPSREAELYGSKLAAVGQVLRRIQREDPSAKAIVFVQWVDLEKLVGATLSRMGIEHVRLKGSTVQRSRVVAAFQEQDDPRVLLQSLENSASGANLTRASHVLLVHPMDADSRDRAVAYEMQALGRVRRCGQTARRVHLWRFVTTGTVEEEVSRQHQLGVSEGLREAGAAGAGGAR